MENLRLREIIKVGFNKLDSTNFKELYRHRKWGPVLRSLKKDECVMFISVAKNCVSFVKGFVEIRHGQRRWVIFASRRHRIERGPGLSNEFEPKMLGNYARFVGINLVGLPLFEAYLSHLQ